MEAAFVLSLIVAWLRGGRFSQLSALDFGWWPLIFVSALARGYIRMAPTLQWPLGPWLVAGLYLVSYGAVFAFFWRNRGYSGIPLLAAGTALNFAVIAANGFQMPVLPWAVAQLGVDPATVDMSYNLGHQFITEATRLPWLGDVVPVWIPGVPRQVFRPVPMSVGDFLEIAGMFLLVQRATGAGQRDVQR